MAETATTIGTATDVAPLHKSKEEWRALLPADVYQVMFEEATECAGTSPLNDEKRSGIFVCRACHLPLFNSRSKFNSGTGWPSFYEAAIPGHVGTKTDRKFFMVRTEFHCARCEGHLGHVFDDGPRPTGQRYCTNGVALIFVPDGEPLPALVS